jgi:hypothetical protein
MSATPRGVKGPPKLIRILMLPLLIILLLLLVAYAALPYLPLRAPAPQAAATPLAPLTEVPSLTPAPPMPTETPSATPTPAPRPTEAPAAAATGSPTVAATLTNTPVVLTTPTATRTAAPLAAVSPTRARPSPTPTPTEAPADMEALAETAQPQPSPSPTAAPVVTAPPPTRPPATSAARPTLAPPPAGSGELLANGDFSDGYQDNGVAVGWNAFGNSHAEFHYRADDWPRVIVAPDTGQTMRIRNADLPDRYLGIYQTVNVVPGQVYTFSIAGLVRTNVGDVQHTRFGYRMEVGFDTLGTRNWKRVPEWIELPWDEQARDQEAYRIEVFTTTVEAETERLTVFVRAWKKWADAGEGAYDVLRASLVGPLPPVSPPPPPAAPADGPVQALGMPVTGQGETTLWEQIRLAITLLLLAVLVGGALWRLRPWRVR